MSRNFLRFSCLLLAAFICISPAAFAAAFDDTLSSDPIGGGAHASTFTRTLGGVSYTYTFTSQGEGGDMVFDSQFGTGNSSSILVTSLSFNASTTELITIARTDGNPFTFSGIYINNSGGQTVSVGGYLSGSLVGTAQTDATGAAATLNFGTIKVDQVRVTATDFFNTNLDDFSGDTNPPNAAPVATTSGGTTAFTEGNNVASTPVVLDSGITITDSDNSTLASGTVSITGNFQSSQDVLAFTNNPATMGNIGASYNSSTGVLSLSSAGATATVAQWQAAFRSVTYTNSSDSPNTGNRTLSFVVNDGAANSSAGTKTVSVTSTNDTPIATGSGGTTAFTEGNNVTSTPVVVDSGITNSDLDSSTFASATVSITGNLHAAEDVLAFTNNPATMGNISGSYNSGTGVFSLSSAGATATLAQWQAALRSVTYTNSSNSPNTSNRTISFAVNDGSTSSSATTKTVSIASTNDAPVDTTSGGNTAFTEGNNVTSTPVVIDSGFTVIDGDNSTLASASIAITGNFQSSEDILAFTNNPATMGNISGSYNSGTGVLILTSAGATATVAQWQAALRSLTYTNSSSSPNTGNRAISFTINDGTDDGNTATKIVTVASTNNTPIATATGGTTTFTEGDNVTSTPVVVDNGITVTDADNATLASATVSITGNFQSSEDILAFTNNPATMGNISGSYNSGTGVLTLTSSGATATTAQWQAALRTVIYTNSSDAPNTNNRTISIAANDGSASSNAATKTVAVTSVNDAPVNSVPSAQSVPQDGSLHFNAGHANIIGVSDVDAESSSIQVTLTAMHGALTLAGISGLSFSVGSGSSDATMTFTGATSSINNALNGLIYQPVSGYSGAATLQIVTNDLGNTGSGGAKTDTDTIGITVIAANLPPTNVALSASSVNRSAAANAAVGTLSSTDGDSVSFTYSLVSGAGSTDNGSFNISGSTLRINNASLLVGGSYSVRIRTVDDQGGAFEKIFSITVVDDVTPHGSDWQISASGDFNGDGKADIIWANKVTGRRVLWLLNGVGNGFVPTRAVELGNVDINWVIVGTGDFNDDGQTDILWQNTSTGERFIWFMNYSDHVGGSTLGIVDPAWSIAAVADFNGDGHADILWQNSTTGVRFIWFMSGAGHIGGVSLGAVRSGVVGDRCGRFRRRTGRRIFFGKIPPPANILSGS